MLAPGSEVDITVSTGDPDVVVPSVIGDNKLDAVATIEGLVAKLVRVQSDDERDTVTRTDPEAATSVSAGSTVRIFWSTGPRAVPGVVGFVEDEARAWLERAGFEVLVDEDPSGHRGRGRPGARAEPVGGQPSEPGHDRDDHGLDLRAGADAEPDAHRRRRRSRRRPRRPRDSRCCPPEQ